MDNLWLLTEERPKPPVIKQIIDVYCSDFNDEIIDYSEIKIKPLFSAGCFKFVYEVEGISLKAANKIFIKTVSGYSSFLDFLLFKQEEAPREGNDNDNLIMAIEETKTNDTESRNTGVYQRASKFVYIKAYYSEVKLYMLYNQECSVDETKKPSNTNIFGTNMLLTLGVKIIGKNTTRWFKPFKSIDELKAFKAKMKKSPKGNVPISIIEYDNCIEITGRLSKPAEKGNIGHDPNIGALSLIAACIRKLGWKKDIVISMHGVSQKYVDSTQGANKFLYICSLIGIKLKDIKMPAEVNFPPLYWHYEKKSEKMADILLHLQLMYYGMQCVYENHAGCERGYFKSKTGHPIVIPKLDKNKKKLSLPDVVLYDSATESIILVEGKKRSAMQKGLKEIENYDSIEQGYILPEYKDAKITRWLSIFGGNCKEIPHNKILFYWSEEGRFLINQNAPQCVKNAFAGLDN